nr:MAG TPA: hypothetical protein [Caudoviricetes sp.]
MRRLNILRGTFKKSPYGYFHTGNILYCSEINLILSFSIPYRFLIEYAFSQNVLPDLNHTRAEKFLPVSTIFIRRTLGNVLRI